MVSYSNFHEDSLNELLLIFKMHINVKVLYLYRSLTSLYIQVFVISEILTVCEGGYVPDSFIRHCGTYVACQYGHTCNYGYCCPTCKSLSCDLVSGISLCDLAYVM